MGINLSVGNPAVPALLLITPQALYGLHPLMAVFALVFTGVEGRPLIADALNLPLLTQNVV